MSPNGASNGLDAELIAVAGDSVGGGMTAALALMAIVETAAHLLANASPGG